MIGSLVSDGAGTLANVLLRMALADLASWQEAGIAFGFVLGILVVGFLLERWGVDLHA
ncbi:MAG: hypothetical protein ABEJ27_03585 [Halodesulfurarchaeum sp.]